MKMQTSLLTITFNCMVAGLCAGILFSLFICSLVILLGSLSAAGASPGAVETGVTAPGEMPLASPEAPRIFITSYACRQDAAQCRDDGAVEPDKLSM